MSTAPHLSARGRLPSTWSALLARTVILGVLALAFSLQTRTQWRLIEEGTQGFLIGDWTINYAGGVVRRGFAGWLLMLFAPEAASALPTLWVIQTMLYAVTFGVVVWWTIRLPDPMAWAPLLLSPAFLLFGLNDFGGTHRKEIIVFAGLFVLAESVRCGRAVIASTGIALFFFSIGVLSHEANIFFVMAFILLLKRAMDDGLVSKRTGGRIAAGFVAAATLGLVVAVLAPGTVEQQHAICNDLLRRGFEASLCRGSLSYIGEPASGQVMRILVDALPGYALYAVPAMFALIPFMWSSWAQDNRRLLFFAVAPILPLFLIAVDWGRWIMWAVVIGTVLTVVGSTRDDERPRRMPLPVLVLFVIAWSVPHVGMGPSAIGHGELLVSVQWAVRMVKEVLLG